MVADRFGGHGFKEFVADFSATGHAVAEISERLRRRGILAGHDLGPSFPALAGCALFAVTEVHGRDDIDALATAIEEVLT